MDDKSYGCAWGFVILIGIVLYSCSGPSQTSKDIDALKFEVSELEMQIKDMKRDRPDYSQHISSLEYDVERLRSHIEDDDRKIDDLQSRRN